MPMDKSKYPDDWDEISRHIRFERAGGRCEGSPAWSECRARHGLPHPVTGSIVVLTTSHLDHDTSNNNPANLRAMCQRCHLTHDAELHASNAAKTRRRKQIEAGQLELSLTDVWTWLTRIDPATNANRWYAVGVQSTLLDDIAVVRFWGSRKTAFQQMKVELFADVDEARAAADKLIRAKVRQKNSYRITAGRVPPGLDQEPATVTGDGEQESDEGLGTCPLCGKCLRLARVEAGMILYCSDGHWQEQAGHELGKLVERLGMVTKLADLVGAPVTTGGHETGGDND